MQTNVVSLMRLTVGITIKIKRSIKNDATHRELNISRKKLGINLKGHEIKNAITFKFQPLSPKIQSQTKSFITWYFGK